MKTGNFPARKVARQIGALDRFKRVDAEHRSSGVKTIEFAALNAAVLAGSAARDIRTKKHRGPRASF
jgi:hypothetical protein